jgi:DNA helicase-2/ATP-dependent DNA helicase PcrA
MKAKIIIAGPGTGKTRRIIQLVHEFLETSKGTQKGFILCTFTRKAAEELQYRLFEQIDPGLIAGRQYLIDTIHSISLSLLKLHPEGKYAEYEIIPDDEAASYINGQLPRLGFDRDAFRGAELWTLCSEIAEIYGYITDREVDLTKLDFSSNEKLETIVDHFPRYLKLLSRDNKFDFALVQATLKSELINDLEFKKKIDSIYGAFFVDEYQDTNPIQHSLLMTLASPDYKLAVVGDDDQSIYGFRGATVENLIELPNFYTDTFIPHEVEYLQNNHRSVSEIVDFSRNFIAKSGVKGFEKNIKSHRGEAHVKPAVHEFERIDQEALAVSESIKGLIDSGAVESYDQIAILLRTAKNRAKEFAKALEKRNIPYKLIGVGDFFELQFVREFLAIVGFIFNVNLTAIDEFRNELIEINPELSSFYFEGEVITKLLDIKDNWRNYKSSIAIVYDLLNAAEFFERYATEGKNIGKLTQLVMSHDENIQGLDLYGLFSYLSFLRREKLIDVETDDDIDAVQIMTLHKAKGLQFDAIYMPVQNELSPQISTVDVFKDITGIAANNMADELRLFYVGITRARNYLWISRCRTSPTGKKTYNPSAGYQIILTDSEFYEAQDHFPRSEAIKATPKIKKLIPILSYNAIYTYQICPKQYMYRDIWQLDTARNAGMTYGSNLHKALQLINAEISKGTDLSTIDLDKIMSVAWKHNWRASESDNIKFKETALKQLKSYISNFDTLFANYNFAGIEKQFDISVDETLITGRYDAVFENNNNEMLIVDFKTGDERDYSFQMNFYEFCLKFEFAKKEIASKIYYLNTGALKETLKFDQTIVKAEINKTKSNLENQIYTATPGPHCSDCAFNLMCPEGLARP